MGDVLLTVVRRVLLAITGVVLCFAGLVAHRHAWYAGDVALPWGLVLAVAASVAVTLAGAELDHGPGGAVAVAAGWAVMLLLGFQGRPEGDYILASDWRGYGFLLAGLVGVGAAVVVTVGRPARTSRA